MADNDSLCRVNLPYSSSDDGSSKDSCRGPSFIMPTNQSTFSIDMTETSNSSPGRLGVQEHNLKNSFSPGRHVKGPTSKSKFASHGQSHSKDESTVIVNRSVVSLNSAESGSNEELQSASIINSLASSECKASSREGMDYWKKVGVRYQRWMRNFLIQMNINPRCAYVINPLGKGWKINGVRA